MSRSEFLSVMALYHYDNTLFSEMAFPEGFTAENKETVIANILSECAELEVLFTSVPIMKEVIHHWSRMMLPNWQRIYRVEQMEYNPLENYHRNDKIRVRDTRTETHSGTDTTTDTKHNTQTNSGTDARTRNSTNSGTDSEVNSVTGYNSGTAQVRDRNDLTHGHAVNETDNLLHGHIINDNGGGSSSMIHGEQITHGGSLITHSEVAGNIGVTTTQKMANQEIELAPAINTMNRIVTDFRARFCLEVY